MRTVRHITQGDLYPMVAQVCGHGRVGNKGADVAIVVAQLTDDALAEYA